VFWDWEGEGEGWITKARNGAVDPHQITLCAVLCCAVLCCLCCAVLQLHSKLNRLLATQTADQNYKPDYRILVVVTACESQTAHIDTQNTTQAAYHIIQRAYLISSLSSHRLADAVVSPCRELGICWRGRGWGERRAREMSGVAVL
jgi:hypothetical protein